MVTHINIAVDDEVADRAREIKDDRGLSWAEFVEEAVQEFEDANAANEGDGHE